ncbi:MAG: UDP-N-acetylglucosamine 2-epimerase [Candidatus Syntrophoarchaeum caldarius]|uniref:UDP-N-acetylglucosamine 2-epimerase n=1 Tax=Candidatus Syntropharchaeum caldarium TaxID=1838285 RepID=A0A1F2PBZ9_9EURY|nr:MAG: UDP-N-acetylglucosamine 2-epimerase [Candidatus Syntrophoarchaeum caldarius]
MCEGSGLDYLVLHTGQHYSYEMDRVFFQEIEMPDVKYKPREKIYNLYNAK